MSKMKYIQPQMDVESVSTDAFVMLLDSGSGLEPGKPQQHVPMRQNPEINIP